ncbi:MAG: FtsP/CotA-like multicopper oxidase with cupredoxin domain, partial [Planctomycetota bacterium]
GTIGLGDDPEDGFKDTVKYFDMKLIGPDPGGPYYAPPTILDPGNIVELDILDVDKTVNVTFGHSTPDAAGNVNFFAVVDGGTPMPFPKLTSLVAADLEIGDVVQWNVKNLSHGDHPFHTHGFAFQWYETEYFDAVTPAFNYFEFPTQITNKDTILVPARTGAKGTSNTTLRALMLIDDTGREGRLTAQGRWPTANTSGGYLFHCHILEHVTRGMMGFFEVFDPTDPFANLGGATANIAGGHAYLSGTGDVTAGTPLTIDLQDSIPGAPSFLAIGATQTVVPLTLGFFLPTLTLVLGPNMPDALGNINKNYTWPAGLPAGTEIFWQWATFDTPTDISVSNALRTRQL